MDNEARKFAENILNGYIQCKRWSDDHYEKGFERGGNFLTAEQFRVLHFVKITDIRSLPELARAMGISESAVSITVSKLTASGLMRKQKCAGADGRRIQFFITDSGIAAADEILNNLLTGFKDYYNSLDNAVKEPLCEGIALLNGVFTSLNERLKLQEVNS